MLNLSDRTVFGVCVGTNTSACYSALRPGWRLAGLLRCAPAKTANYGHRTQLGSRHGEAQRAVAIQMLVGNCITTVAKVLNKLTLNYRFQTAS
ncbi:MAG TPA: hypothetical protein PK580_09825 [Nitrosomonas halophila]|nr:hypothetical protein [Nitrosomonas halophila]